jgi:hypothetical protein
MSDSAIYAYPTLFTEKLLEARKLNDSLNTNEYYVQNEYWINVQYFIALQYGMDSLSAEVKQQIGNLAMECPYVAGKAVFKIRTLNNLLNPLANYDDLQLCNSAGIYKNGTVKGLFDDENNELDSLGKNDGLQLIYGIAKSGIKVYPNPASQKITIKYNLKWNESGLLIFYDLIGRERIRINLSNKSNIVLSNIPELCDGVYTYKYLINNRAIETGKLSVVK